MLLRVLVVLLACMNIGVGLWWALHVEAVPVTAPSSDPGVGSLVLLSESPRPPVAAEAELSADPDVLSAGSVCLGIGPFTEAAALRTAMNRLLPRVERIQYREVAATVLKGYRVYLPPSASHADALAIARVLAARGVSDYYVVTAGGQQDSIALGNFRDLANATARRDAIAALGFAPTVEPRMEAASQWWIDLAAVAGFDWKAALAGQESSGLQASAAPCR
jgi:hypothetical protein